MITISKEQWDRIGQESFDARMVAVIQRSFPEQAARVPSADLVHAVHRQTTRARGYGLNDERSAATYVFTAWMLGEEFDQRIPALSQILRERRMSAHDKAAALGNFAVVALARLGGAPVNPLATEAAR